MSNVIDSLGRIKVTTSGSGGSNVWPKSDKLNIDTTEYGSVTLALAALAAGQQLLIGEGTYTCNLETVAVAAYIKGSDIDVTTLTSSASATTLILGAAVILDDLTITNSNSGSPNTGLKVQTAGCVLSRVKASVQAGNIGTRKAFYITNVSTSLINCQGVCTGGTTALAVYTDTGGTTRIVGGIYTGKISADSGTTIILEGPTLLTTNPILLAGSGIITGHYYDASGNLITLDGTGKSSGIWLIDGSSGLKTKEVSLAAAIAASVNDNTIKLDSNIYSVGVSQAITTSITIEGDGPEATVYASGLSNTAVFDINANSITVIFRNIKIQHTGGGVAATGIFSNNSGVTVVLDNAVVEISSGAGTDSRGLWIEAGTWTLRNGSKIVVTSGTNKYAIYNDSAAATINLGAGCALNGATADIYSDQSGSTINFDGVALLNNIMNCAAAVNGFCLDSKYRNAGFVAVNNSGATRAAGDVCDIDITGKLTTTTTATAVLSWTVVSIGNTSANQCFVRRQGRVTCGYTGTDPSAGHFLVTSTSAGLGQRQTTMRPEIYAVCVAAGSSGAVEAMLLTTRIYETSTDIHFIYGIEAASDSDFVATINGAPSGTSVVYNVPSSGSDNTIVPWAALDGSNFNAKTVLWNTTRSTSALISSVNTGTKTITLTAAVPAGWQSGDTITARSQTNTQNWSGGAYYFEWDISGWAAKPVLATAIVIESSISDTSATVAALSSFHPFEAFVASKNFQRWSQAGAANVRLLAPVTVPILSDKFTLGWDATGSATTTVFGSLAGWIVAAP